MKLSQKLERARGKNVFIYTGGCKANFSDSMSIIKELKNMGANIVEVPEEAEVFVLNSCTVTERADRDLIKTVKRFKKLNPDSELIITGCTVEVYPDKIKSRISNLISEPLLIKKRELFESFKEIAIKNGRDDDIRAWPFPSLSTENSRTRYFFKIQDGCNYACTYCVIHIARGKSRSLGTDEVINHLKKISHGGVKEVVLTGIHLGFYGHDLKPGTDLLTLLKKIKEEGINLKIRLSSLEPNEISEELLRFIKDNEFVANHLHVPIQSGDDEILKKMARHYRVKDILTLFEKIVKINGRIGLGTDIITGFPGEEEKHFKNTFNLLKDAPFTYIHVFSYSDRTGTPASRFSGKVTSRIVKQRTKVLTELSYEKKIEFMKTKLNREVTFLSEAAKNGFLTGHTDDYLQVKARGRDTLVNRFLKLKVEGVEFPYITGELYGTR